MRLYIEGHNAKRGYGISLTWSDEECTSLPTATADHLRPVRFVVHRHRAVALVERWNRRFASH